MAHHQPFKALGPIEWESVDQSDLETFLAETFNHARTIIDSLPVPAPIKSVAGGGRTRSHTDPAVPLVDLNRALSQRQTAEAITHAQDLMKEWKEVKINAKENPLAINVYKLAAKDGKGSWFARRSVHDGLTFEKWKLGLEREFNETMKVHTGPGSGSIRGIGAERRVERSVVDGTDKLEVFQLSAQFPGPTSPRDFVTLLLTCESLGFPVTPGGIKRPLRQFIVVSKPCTHGDCPQRQGFIRGQYESIEIIREVPLDKPAIKRARSSIDLGNDASKDARQAAEDVGREAILRAALKATDNEEGRPRGKSNSSAPVEREVSQEAPEESDPPSIEWLMVTRSDPGGSVPRFMIEKGTPGGIVSDAGKFLKWITAKDVEDFTSSDDNDFKEEAIVAEEKRDGNQQSPHSPTANLVPDMPSDQQESVPSSNGLYGMITGAIGAASSAVATRLPNPFGGSVNGSETHTIPEEDELTSSETSSIRSFASAMESSKHEDLSPETMSLAAEKLSTHSDEARKSNTPQYEKELKKLQERRSKLQEKISKMQERMASRRSEEREKDVAAAAKLREKHEREMARQEEKYRRDMKRLEEKRQQEERKAEERRKKTVDREEKANLSMELEKAKAERDLALTQIDILKGQVGELQAQNTLLVAQLGRLGVKREDSSWSALGKSAPVSQGEKKQQAVAS